MTQCSNKRRAAGLAYPRTCSVCGLGPCRETTAFNPPEPTTNTVKHTPTDNQEQIGGNGTDLPVETATDKQAACTDRPDISNSQASSVPADTAGEAPSSSQASPAHLSDDDFNPSKITFLRKSAADYRPYCQKPEACGASGLKHCYTCQKAIDVAEMAEHARVSV